MISSRDRLGTKLIKCDTECLQFFKIGISTGFQGFGCLESCHSLGAGAKGSCGTPNELKFLLLSYEIRKLKKEKHNS